MVKSKDIFIKWVSRWAVLGFTAIILGVIILADRIPRTEDPSIFWDVFPEILGVFSALIYGYYWQDTADGLKHYETWKRTYYNLFIELVENVEKLERITYGNKVFLKTTSWEIHRDGLKGGSSRPSTLASEIYFILLSLNVSFTNEFANEVELVYDAKRYGRYCLKLIDEYREFLESYYGKEDVEYHYNRYSGRILDE